MANRGQKRTEVVDGLPADKRACSSLEFRPSSSNSSAQTPMSSAHEAQDADMDTSSSTSGSTRSEGDGEKESAYGSCDSDNSIHDYYRHRSMSDQSKFKKVLSSLSEEVEESGQLALLTELCELLSFCTDSSLSSLMVDSFSPVLVRLARHESNPDIMLLAIRAITYLCDVNPRSSGFLVRHDAVPVLCQRLMAIEYLDVAEQCLQAMEKISREQPLACLQSGAIMAVLSYIDFFSTSVQRVALSTVVNICKKLSSESPPLFMEAVPILCNLLQYEDRQLVESVATCLIKIGEQVYCSAEMLDDICKHGLVQHILHLIGLNSRTTLCQPTYIGLIGLLVKLAAGSIVAFRTLFELNISNTVKDMLSTYDLSHGTLYVSMVGGHHSQIHEVLKLLNELLPAITEEQDGEQKSDKEVFLLSHPDIVQKFGVDLLPILIQDKESNLLLSSPADTSSSSQRIMDSADVADVQTDPLEPKEHDPLQEDGGTNFDHPGCSDCEETSPKLLFYLESQQLNCKLTLYQSILNLQTETDHDNISSASLWNRIYKLTYRRPVTTRVRHPKPSHDEAQCSLSLKRALFFQYTPYFCPMFASEVDLEKLGPTYDILSLLKSLEGINRLRFHLMSRERTYAFAEGRTDDLDKLNVVVSEVPPNEFVNKKLTEKLEQQMRDPMAVSVGAMPAWCTQLMAWCPFLFGFEARCKYFHLAALGRSPVQTHSVSHGNAGGSGGRQQSRRKILVHRNKILESAAQMMELHTHQKVLFEVEYDEEVGTGLGPTLEFYTLVCHEFQRSGLGMWRDDTVPLQCTAVLETENTGFLVSPFGLFPRPWSPSLSASSSSVYSDVIEKFSLLGYIVAKALQDGRVLDLPFSKALYKLILGKELSLYDIQSFDPASGRALLEFQAVVERKEYLRSVCKEESADLDVCLRNTKIEDLCLDFTLPGYPDYVLVPETDSRMVNLYNLDEYITLIVDATTKSGIARQVEAFKSGFDQVFPIKHLKVFTEEELERLLCGEHVLWNSEDLLDHIKFDHGYTISSPPIVNLLEIMQEFDLKQQRAFLQFVTGAPRLPTGGLASLNPKLTIVRKHCSKGIDADLPSVMTCANYLKLPPYSSKEVMKEKLLYAVTEGQGSFHLS
ncbi:E3 ubiquitin-protein ligase UPL4 isoform X3 [Sesamum indicum]|uniref:HECT-type E3 ubiquitin transferase n=1 Tax=Sesamum indicum TaxID=4182 RepID=A0A8M8V2J7_SESIN|nr:E3 ubiquitin-protein ligase UPL4 isoform X3 [Sesamum indicum]